MRTRLGATLASAASMAADCPARSAGRRASSAPTAGARKSQHTAASSRTRIAIMKGTPRAGCRRPVSRYAAVDRTSSIGVMSRRAPHAPRRRAASDGRPRIAASACSRERRSAPRCRSASRTSRTIAPCVERPASRQNRSSRSPARAACRPCGRRCRRRCRGRAAGARDDQLVGRAGPSSCSRCGSRVGARVGAPRSRRSSSVGVVDEQRRRRVGGRRGVGDVAADRAAVLDRERAGLARGARPSSGNSRRSTRMRAGCRGRSSARRSAIASRSTAMPRSSARRPDARASAACGSLPGLEQHHQVGAAGERRPAAGLAASTSQRVGQATRRDCSS